MLMTRFLPIAERPQERVIMSPSFAPASGRKSVDGKKAWKKASAQKMRQRRKILAPLTGKHLSVQSFSGSYILLRIFHYTTFLLGVLFSCHFRINLGHKMAQGRRSV